ncbi:hypothetical protein [Streptomyces cyaneofuscatus]|uniref:hypothetical protein n=1 Tax=Streptomyces cyaneofuscatus TaxID=66883 RepID=UPI00364965FD
MAAVLMGLAAWCGWGSPRGAVVAQEAVFSVRPELAGLAELEFSPIAPEEAADLDDCVYLLGVRPEFVTR